MPHALDVLLVIAFAALWPLVEHFGYWPRHVRAVANGDPHARPRLYSRWIVVEWVCVGAVMALTFWFARPMSALGLNLPRGWRLWLGVALPAAYLVLMVLQARTLAAHPRALTRLRSRMEPLRPLVPHTSDELGWFVALSLTAGICEELLYRGYLVWFLRSWIGLGAGAAASMVAFGLAHMYQGVKFGVRAFFTGVAMGVLALATRSILPSIALHALIDLSSGWISYLAVRGNGDSSEVAAGATGAAGAA